jgi:hypothetical protein
VYSCPVGAVLVGALLAHTEAIPTQSSKKRKHEPYGTSEKAWLLEIYDKNPRLSAQELGERLGEHVNSKRSAHLVPKPTPGQAHDCVIRSPTSFPPKTGLSGRWLIRFFL